MSKIFLSCILCAALAASSLTVFAADAEKGQPDVYVNDSKIIFTDQAAQIVNDRTLVPARGVFESMGNKVEWDNETRTVTVTSSTGVTVATIVIDSTEMNVRTYKSLMEAEDVTVELDVPAQIMNDRTMIPLRAVSEAFNCEVKWDEENYCVNITTGEPARLEGATDIPTPVPDEEKVTMSLSTDAENVANGDEFDVYINVENVPADCFVSALVGTIEYDKSKFEYVADSSAFLDDSGNIIENSVPTDNNTVNNGYAFYVMNIDESTANKAGGRIYKATFRKLTDEKNEMSIDRSYISGFGYSSYIQFTKAGSTEDITYKGSDIIISKTPLSI